MRKWTGEYYSFLQLINERANVGRDTSAAERAGEHGGAGGRAGEAGPRDTGEIPL
jgi:hypothetical protein